VAHDIQLDGARQILTAWDSSKHLTEIIETIETGLREESDTVIDGAKCLVEAVCKTILLERGAEIGRTDSPAALLRKTTQTLGITEELGGDMLRDMIRGMTAATNGLASMRDAFGPLCHGRDAAHEKLGDWHRLMAVRSAETIVVLLYEAHTARAINLRFTRKPFDENDPANQQIDEAALVEFDDETHEVVINEFLRFRPSEILYAFDRESYVDEKEKAAGIDVEEESKEAE
jgi:hypothetical protein